MLIKVISNFLYLEEGATVVEYAIMASLIGAVIVAIVLSLGIKVNSLFNSCVAGSW